MTGSTTETAAARLGWCQWIRQAHRWISIVFTATVVANFAALGLGEPPFWLYLLPLLPLALLAITGLYMFALPYFAGRSRQVSG